MQNSAILVINEKNSTLVTTVEEALIFLRSLAITIEGKALEIFTENFTVLTSGGTRNSAGGNVKSFKIGGNSFNPYVNLRIVEGLCTSKDLKSTADSIVEKLKEKYANTDIKITATIEESGYKIEGGVNWLWSKIYNAHIAINPIFLRSSSLDIDEQVARVSDNIILCD